VEITVCWSLSSTRTTGVLRHSSSPSPESSPRGTELTLASSVWCVDMSAQAWGEYSSTSRRSPPRPVRRRWP
jgi:hypothetical protein